MKTIWQVPRAAFTRALRAIAVSAARTPRNKHTTRPPRTHHWRSIGTVALLACAFLLPAFAAQAQVATTTSVVSSENPSTVGDTVTLTASVSSNGGAAPTGSVQFTDFKTFTTTTVTLTPGSGDTSTAALTSSTFVVGNHGFDVQYMPTGNFSSSIATFTQQVLAAGVTGTTTQLASSQNPSASGQSVTFTATVAADSGTTAPTGTVTFQVDGNTVSTPTLQTVGGVQQATFTTSSLTVSASGHSVAAIYNLSMASNPNFGQSQGNLNQVVTNGTPTTIAVTSTPNPSTANQSVTFTATVSPTSGFTGSPTGTVDFRDITANTDLGTGTLQNVGGVQKASVSASLAAVETHVIQVTYSGDATFASDVVDFNQVVTTGTATTASIASSQNPSFLGNPVTFTVMIKPTSGTGTPTGNVTIQDAAPGGFSVVVTLNGGQATFTTSNTNNLVAGTNNITVTYPGDATFAASTASFTQTVNTPTATTTTVMSSANPSLVGQSVTFTAAVSPNTATGSVVFTIDGSAGAPIKLSGGVATTSTSALTVAGSPHSVSAAFTSTDGSFGASTGQLTPGQTVNKASTTTSVASSLNPAATGASVTFTATVTGSAGGTPTGTVTFVDITTSLTLGGGPITLQPGGTGAVASVSTSFAGTGTHNIVATYSGDPNFSGGSGTFAEMVNAGTATTTTVSSTANPSVFGQTITFTATVSGSGGTPTGSVTFTIDGIPGSPINLIGGVASFTTSILTVAGSPHAVNAFYSGDGTFTASTGQLNPSQNVTAANTSTTMASSQNPSAQGQSVTFTATVSTNSPGSGTPTGSVVFTIDGTAGSPITLSGGIASTSTSTLTVAGSPHSIFATYTSNTTNFNGSTSNTIQQTVVNGTSTTMLASSANPSTLGQTVTFTATVTGTGSAATPGGTVTFKDGAATLGTGTLGGSGNTATTSITATLITSGPHTITATYGGDTNFTGSSATLTQNVNKFTTTTTLTASPNPATPGQAVTFTATVTIGSVSGTPTGMVTFKDGTTTLGTGTLGPGLTATFTTSSLSSGSHSITAVYGGDTAFSGSTSAAVTEQIGAPADSIKLREMQISTTPVIAQAWGQSTAAAMDDAVSAGFGGNPQSLSPAGTGFTYYFNDDAPAQRSTDADQDSLRRYLASPNGSSASPNGNSSATDAKSAAANDSVKRVDDDFLAMGYAGRMPTKAPPAASSSTPHDWLAWVTVRGTDYFRGTFGNDLKGDQVDVLAGLTRRISPNFVVGAFGGYEHFDYTSQAFTARLKGDGWTAGAYLGWKLAPNLRFDAGGAWSDIRANDTAGTASGNFTGTRWLINGGLTGTYPWQMLILEPSARVFAIWEHENAFTDSLGTFQPSRNFETGRASVGAKAIYPFAWTSSTVALSPYAGLYADYYFSRDDAQTVGLTTVPLLQGFSARATGGVAASFAGGATLGAGGEFGGIGSATHIWTWTARGRIPF